MPSDAFLVKDGKEFGPFSSVELKQLAATGKIGPNDLIKRGRDGRAVPARTIAGLVDAIEAAQREAASTPSAPRSLPVSDQKMETASDAAEKATPANAVQGKAETPAERGFTESLLESLKDSLHLASLNTQIQKLKLVDLPRAYRRLGKEIHSRHLFDENAADLYAAIASLDADVVARRQPVKVDEHATLAERAGAKAAAAKRYAEVESLLHRRNTLLTEIGERTVNAGFSDALVQTEIDACICLRTKLEELSVTASTPKSRRLGRRLAYIAAGCLCLGLLYYAFTSVFGRTRKLPNADPYRVTQSQVGTAMSSLADYGQSERRKVELEIKQIEEQTATLQRQARLQEARKQEELLEGRKQRAEQGLERERDKLAQAADAKRQAEFEKRKRERAAQQKEEKDQRQIAEAKKAALPHAVEVFTAINLDVENAVRLARSGGWGNAKLELRGEDYVKIYELHTKKEWLPLVNVLLDSHLELLPDKETVDHAAKALLQRRFFLLLRTKEAGLLDGKLWLVGFPLLGKQTLPVRRWVESQNGDGYFDSIPADDRNWLEEAFFYSNHWHKHPEGLGYYHAWSPCIETSVIVRGGLERKSDFYRKRQEMTERYESTVVKLSQKVKLGEISVEDAAKEATKERKRIMEEIREWASGL